MRQNRAFPPLLLVLSLLLLAAPAHADGESVLDALSREVAENLALAEANVGTLVVGEVSVPGVFVGPRGWFVAPTPAGPSHKTATVRLPDGTELEAAYADGDAELGVAVYRVEESDAAGMTAGTTWPTRAGTVALAVGGPSPDLVILPATDALRGDLAVAAPDAATVLVGARGTLLGLRVRAWSPALRVQGVILDPHGRPVGLGVPPLVGSLPRLGPDSALRLWLQGVGEVPYQPAVGTGGIRVRDDASLPRWIPGPVLARAVEEVATHGRLPRPYLGIVPEGSATVAEAWVLAASGWTRTAAPGASDGARIVAVLPGSPAAAAGLESGARVIAVDGADCPDSRALVRAIARRRPGETIALTVKGWAEDVQVTLGTLDEAKKALRTVADIGVECVPLGRDLARYLGVPEGVEGLVVRAVAPGLPAEKAGLQASDVLLRGAGGPLRDLEELDTVLAAAGDVLPLTVLRGGVEIEVEIRLPSGSVGPGAR